VSTQKGGDQQEISEGESVSEYCSIQKSGEMITIELYVPICLMHNIYNGEKLDYVDVNTLDGDSLKFSVEKDKLKGLLELGNKISVKSKIKARVFKNGLSLQLIEPQVKAVE